MRDEKRAEAVDLAADIAALRVEFKARGFYERPISRMLVEWIIHFAIGISGLVAFGMAPSWPLRIAATLFSCYGFIGLATLGHTASHNACSDSRAWNRFVLFLTYPFLVQLSASFWHYTHVVTHHPSPNIVGIDNDCDLRPLFYINQHQQANASALRRFYFRIQGFIFPIALCLNTFNIQRKGWKHVVRELRNPKTRTAFVWADFACMSAHLLVCLGIPMLFFPAKIVVAVYMLWSGLIGIGLFCILAPGHFPAAAVVLERGQKEESDFYLRQTATTVNFRTGFFGRFMCSGLEYQVEHHLFPNVCHIHYPKIEPLVRDLCARHGMPYNMLGWPNAIWQSYRVFFFPKRVLSSVESVRERPLVAPVAHAAHQAGESASDNDNANAAAALARTA